MLPFLVKTEGGQGLCRGQLDLFVVIVGGVKHIEWGVRGLFLMGHLAFIPIRRMGYLFGVIEYRSQRSVITRYVLSRLGL
jgi:hypothetical protein